MDDAMRHVEARFEADRWTGEPWGVGGASLIERLNAPYLLRADLAVDDPMAEAVTLLGSSCLLTLVRRRAELRVCGVVTRVHETVEAGHGTRATIAVEPALAALRHRVDTRIFQHMTVPEILEAVLRESLGAFGRSLDLDVEGSYAPREYCVQFRESDFDFAHRLMEEEGIGYRFDHLGSVEKLVLFDRPAHHPPIQGEGGSRLRYVLRHDASLDSAEGDEPSR